MKNDLIITRFKTEPTIGTKNSYDPKTFFGSKMVDVEDNIIIDDINIQYSEVRNIVIDNNIKTENNGYQYFEDLDEIEKVILKNLSDLKLEKHTINLVSQSTIDLQNNTQWILYIDWKDILTEYIFYKLKNRRTFKCIRYDNILNENINYYIKEYIRYNLLNRYNFSEIKFYIKYYDLDDGNENVDPNLLFNPIFSPELKIDDNLIKDINVINTNDKLTVNYKQTESSENKKFNYYFDLFFVKT